MKKNFFAGLAILLPAVLTFIIVAFLVNILTKPFIGTVAAAFNHYGILNQPFLFLSGEQVLILSSKLIILVGILTITFLIGILAEILFVRYIGNAANSVIHRIPLIRVIYKSIQDVLHHLFDHKKEVRFSSVVLAPFPHNKSYSIGLVTNETRAETSDAQHVGLISVFIPGTPNPTMGFMLLFRREQLIHLDMKVDEALKFIVSCGVVYPERLSKPVEE